MPGLDKLKQREDRNEVESDDEDGDDAAGVRGQCAVLTGEVTKNVTEEGEVR